MTQAVAAPPLAATSSEGAARLRSRGTVVLVPPRPILYKWIDARTSRMVEAGLLAELDALRRRYSAAEIDDALRPLGVRGLVGALESGQVTTDMPPDDPAR